MMPPRTFLPESDVDTARTTAVADDNSSVNHFGRRRRRRTAPNPTSRLMRLGWSASGLAAVTVLAAACSGGGGYASPYGGGQSTSSGAPSAAVVGLRASTIGQTLVDGQGDTLYLFAADTGGKSQCSGACAAVWPPYLGVGTPQAGTGVTAGLLSTITRGDGGTQVTYGGHPLYRYAGDTKPGDVTGQALDQYGGKWYVLGADGSKIDTD
jgi:predicted lipoprotein with Yx(FWY)xxD motif